MKKFISWRAKQKWTPQKEAKRMAILPELTKDYIYLMDEIDKARLADRERMSRYADTKESK